MIPVIFINCRAYPFIQWIINGTKKVETRNKNTLGKFIGQRVYLAETGHGKPIVKCSAIIKCAIEIHSFADWRTYVSESDVPLFSSYDWQRGTKHKVIYELEDVMPVKPFEPTGPRHGRVWMEHNDTTPTTSNTDRMSTIESFIEIFEDFLDEKGIYIQNEDKDLAAASGQDPETFCNIYGCDYGILSDKIENLLVKLGTL